MMSDSNSDIEEMNANDLNPIPNQRQRVIMQPFDSFLSNNIHLTNPLFEEISLQALESDDSMSKRLNFKHVYLLILRIITSSHLISNVCSRKKFNKSESNKIQSIDFVQSRVL